MLFLVPNLAKSCFLAGQALRSVLNLEIAIKRHTKTDAIEMKATNQKSAIFNSKFREPAMQTFKIPLGQFVRQKSAFKVVFTKKEKITN